MWSFKLLSITFAALQKPRQGNFEKFQRSGESRFDGSENDRSFLKITKWQQKLVWTYKRGKLVSFFLNNAAKTCLFGLKILETIEIGHVFQSRAFFHFSSNLYRSCLSAFENMEYLIFWTRIPDSKQGLRSANVIKFTKFSTRHKKRRKTKKQFLKRIGRKCRLS